MQQARPLAWLMIFLTKDQVYAYRNIIYDNMCIYIIAKVSDFFMGHVIVAVCVVAAVVGYCCGISCRVSCREPYPVSGGRFFLPGYTVIKWIAACQCSFSKLVEVRGILQEP